MGSGRFWSRRRSRAILPGPGKAKPCWSSKTIRYTVEMVSDLGYQVVSAPDGRAALQVLDAHPELRLLFTDVGLPGGMNGRQLADEAIRRRPGIKVLFTTGYARNAIVHHGRLDPGVEVIFKP